ncbi:MAG TPA: DUF2905 domain-containing protein [Dissulfuribacter thermophilus]|uniref:DUF2905 domain-containing protein n=1 Tax=Dissulfuribacter thermophilus TaxID=1156395 RepID=A0A7V2SV83_9BACT|nr:DUF2905 domain-containing protein [Dissulfuribacter thermophilus]HFC46643.1 DUF2905 domain-containing protein [Dissulfuribacter thermophilus]
MNPFYEMGKMMIFFGIILVLFGLVLTLGAKIPLIGRLPGDISYHRGNFHFYFPLGTSILLSIVLTLILWLIRR